MANLSPIHKKDDPTLVQNFRPISLLCILSKLFERCVFNHCFLFLCTQLYHLQHGFLKGRSTTSQLLRVYNDILTSLSKDHEVDVIFLYLEKAFDKVSHGKLMEKLNIFGIEQQLSHWFKSYITGRHAAASYSRWRIFRLARSYIRRATGIGDVVYIDDMPIT